MKTPQFQFIPGKPRSGKVTYKKGDFALECFQEESDRPRIFTLRGEIDARLGIDSKPDDFLVSADTLTLTFVGEDLHLSLIDAYTNPTIWRPLERMTFQKAEDWGSLTLRDPPKGTDRMTFGKMPAFEYCEAQQSLRIDFGGIPLRYVRLSSCLYAGLSKSELILLDMTDLEILE